MQRKWIVAFAGLGVNLVLGVLYAWGVISAALIDQLGWTATMTQIPYMVACAVFALAMIPGGRTQDLYGPKLVLIISAILAGTGFFFSGRFLSVMGLTVFFGIVFGLAMGLGYAAPTPAAVKWFSKKKRGLIAGITVSGFGLGPLYIAPLADNLLMRFGIENTFYILGALFFVVIMILSQFISNPPKDYKILESEVAEISATSRDFEWKQMIKTPQFFYLWVMFACGTFAGLLTIGQMSKIGLEQAGITSRFLLIAIYAIANCVGRVFCGILSDKLGRIKTLSVLFFAQIIVYMFMPFVDTSSGLILLMSVIGITFGGMLTLFPAITADFFGSKNLGVNYGLVFTAWGIGGVFGPLLGGMVRDITGAYLLSYYFSAALSVIGMLISLSTKAPILTSDSSFIAPVAETVES